MDLVVAGVASTDDFWYEDTADASSPLSNCIPLPGRAYDLDLHVLHDRESRDLEMS